MDQSWTGRQKLTFAIGTLVMFAAAMSAIGYFSRPYTDATGAWLISNLGLNGALWVVLGSIPVLYAIGWWFNRNSAPDLSPPRPLWFKIVAVILLSPPIIGLAIIIGVELAH